MQERKAGRAKVQDPKLRADFDVGGDRAKKKRCYEAEKKRRCEAEQTKLI